MCLCIVPCNLRNSVCVCAYFSILFRYLSWSRSTDGNFSPEEALSTAVFDSEQSR